jgi:hypothetical protein
MLGLARPQRWCWCQHAVEAVPVAAGALTPWLYQTDAVFFIEDKTGAALFVGQVVDPTVQQG